MQHHVEAWEEAEQHASSYPISWVENFSPNSLAILEFRGSEERRIIERMYSNSDNIGSDGPNGWGIKYACEFHMTNDSKLFPSLSEWKELGYEPDVYGNWLKGEWHNTGINEADPKDIRSLCGQKYINLSQVDAVALPLYQGGMTWQFDYAAKVYGGGAGNKVKWLPSGTSQPRILSQFLMSLENAVSVPSTIKPRIAFRDVQNATNQRTFIAHLNPGFPCGNTLPVYTNASLSLSLRLVAAFTSFPMDRVLRIKMSQNHVNKFIAEELPIPRRLHDHFLELEARALSLSAV
jgi:hypothetical protein